MAPSHAPHRDRHTGRRAHPRQRRAVAAGALLLPMLFAFGAAPGAAAGDEPAPATAPPVAPDTPETSPAAPTETPAPDAGTASDAPAAEPTEPPASEQPADPATDAAPAPDPQSTPPAATPSPDVTTAPPVTGSAAPTAEPTRAPAESATGAPRRASAAPARLAPAAALPARLGTADAFAILAGSTITNSGRSVVTGDVGLHPGSAVTGFDSCTGPANCVDLTGSMHVTNGVARQAKADLLTAYDTLVGLEGTCTPLVVELGGTTLTPGVYCSPTFGLTGTLTLSGVGEFVFLTGAGGSGLTTAPDSEVLLVDGADACGVYWQVASSAVVAQRTAFAGNVLARTSISFGDAATLDGSALALDAAVTLIGDTITDSRCAGGNQETPPDEEAPDEEAPDDDETPPGDDDAAPRDDDAGALPGVGMPGGAGSGGGGTQSGHGRSLAVTGSPIELQLLLAALALGLGTLLVLLSPRPAPPGRHRRGVALT